MALPPPWLVRSVTRLADALAKLRRSIIPARFAIIELGTASWVALGVAAFCELGLPDALATQARSARELESLGYGHAESLFRLLRALSAYDIVRHRNDDRFALARLGRALCGPNSAAPMIRYANAPWHVGAYAHLAKAIGAGRPAFDDLYGEGMFAFFERDQRAGALFDSAMQSLTPLYAAPFAAAYPFRDGARVVDVGGGTGAMLAAILARKPSLEGIVFDLPPVIARGCELQAAGTVSSLVRFAPGDMLRDPFPEADAYVFSHIAHDWDDEACVTMLESARRGLRNGGVILVYEIVAPKRSRWWSQDRITDLEMLAMLRGKERTREEFTQLFSRAGLCLTGMIATSAPESILEARPIRSTV